MKKGIGFIIFLLLLAAISGMIVTIHAEAAVIDNGNYEIGTDGVYQLPEDYSGIITIGSGASEVTVTDAVYNKARYNTSIVVAARTTALKLTVEDINFNSTPGTHGIDFGGAGNYANKLYISGANYVNSVRHSDMFNTPNAGIRVPSGVTLGIDKVSDDNSDRLIVYTGGYGAGIGGGENESGGNITISGGTVTVTQSYGAGIGAGSFGADGGNIVINGGFVTAMGICGAGIGGGWNGTAGNIVINGGTVTATTWGMQAGGIGCGDEGSGGNITISGGDVTATGGDSGAGIGGGYYGIADLNITINGGKVTANGGANGGPGIGGYGGNRIHITISGGEVRATGRSGGAGIGSNYGSDGGNVVISGGIVTATGGSYAAGIGSGYEGNGGNITISGGEVTATGGSSAAGIGGGKSYLYSGTYYGGSGGTVIIIGTPILRATGDIAHGAEHIGRGQDGQDSGTLKDGSGADLSYLRFDTSGLAGAKIRMDVIENEYTTNDQGICDIFVPRSESAVYTVSKKGYAAVSGTQELSSMNYDINIPLLTLDNTPPSINNVNPSQLQSGTIINAAFSDYGIYGTLYFVPKAGSDYTTKAALDAAPHTIARVGLDGSATTAAIDTTSLEEGTYQVYVVDSAENVSSPCELVIDNTPPTLDSAVWTDNTHITVAFDEDCTDAVKDNDGGFGIQETGNPGIVYEVYSVAQGTDANHIVLVTTDLSISGKEGVTVKYTAGGNGAIQDQAGNAMATDDGGVAATAWDTTAPTVVLSQNKGNTNVKLGDTVTVTAVFNEDMSDNPVISITNGSVTGAAMTNGSGDKRTWTYTWTVPDGDAAAVATVAGSDIAGNDYAGGDNLTFTIDNTAPEVASVSVPGDGTYVAGQNLDFNVTFTENVAVDIIHGTPSLTVNIGAQTAKAEYISGSGSDQCLFRCMLQPGALDPDGIILGSDLVLNSGKLTDEAGNNLLLALHGVEETGGIHVDAVSPEVESVTVPADSIYAAGNTLDFTVNLSEAVTVATDGGVPYVTVTLDTGGTVNTSYVDIASTPTALVFRYTVQAGQEDKTGITLGNAINLNGSTIKDAAGNAALTALNGVAAISGIKIDTIAPVLSSAAVMDNTHINMTLSEECINITKGNNGGFTVFETGAPGVTYTVGSIAQGADARHVVLMTADIGTSGKEGITVKYTAGGNGTIQDQAGNAMDSDDDGAAIVAWDTTAPTVTLYHSSTSTCVKQGDLVTITAVFNEGMANTPAITIANMGVIGADMTNGSGDKRTWTYTWAVPDGDVTAVATVAGSDLAGNDYAGGGSINFTIDNTAPEVADGTLTVSNVTQTGAALSWNKASDLVTAEARLKYCVYQLSSDSINAVADVEAYGTVKQDYTANIGALNITGLQPGTTNYFNVVVRDEAGNKNCYTSMAVTTNNRSYDHPGTSTGNITTAPAAQTQTPPAANTAGDGNANIQATPTLNSSTGTATAAVSEEALNNALTGTGGNTKVVVEILKVAGAQTYETILPAVTLAGASGKAVEIRTELATVIMPSDMLAGGIAGNAAAAALAVSMADTSKLPEKVQTQIGNKPVIELSLKLDGKTTSWSNSDAPVTVKIPFKPTAEELADPEHITVWYIDGAGNATAVPSGRYDPATGTVSFTTTHFSKYAVVYVKKSFTDIAKSPWAKKQIEVMTAKGIMNGRTDKEFAPQAGITRAEYISALVRTLGVSARFDTNFNDVKAGSAYYDEIGIAKSLGITSGVGNNSFRPGATITRQEMLVMTERALRSLKRISKTGTMENLKQFSDANRLAVYSVNSIAALVKEGLVTGSGGKLNADSDTTRAEAAVFLYRIYNTEL